ncbi:hypothetical protein LTR53_015880 [Teratosphaeriaceae sp. CCFEE 6253]|nr:hypothetical protein LTR53_015880 [Teratosphaeriaceae sp. CCFEE 6253]
MTGHMKTATQPGLHRWMYQGWDDDIRYAPSAYSLVLKRLPPRVPVKVYEAPTHASTPPSVTVNAFVV